MEVSKISQNLMQKRQNHAVNSNSPAFKGGLENRSVNELRKATKVKMPKFIDYMNKLRVLKGETGGIIINALGTGLVAPIFIAYNPLSKADSDTKQYTAMRQPVSAALAILIQAGLTKPLGAFYDYLANNGKLGKSVWLNMQKLNSEGYLKSQAKKLGLRGAAVSDSAQNMMKIQQKEAVKYLSETGTIHIADKIDLSNGHMKSIIDKTIDFYKEKIDKQIKEIEQKPKDFKIKRAQLLISAANESDIQNLCNAILEKKETKEAEAVLDLYLNSNNKDIRKLALEFKERGSLEAMRHRASNTLDKTKLFQQSLQRINFLVKNDSFIIKKLNSIETNPNSFNDVLNELRALSKNAGSDEIESGLHLTKIAEELSHRMDDKSRIAYAQKIIKRISEYKESQNEPLKLIKTYQKAYYSDSLEELVNQKAVLDSMKLGKIKDEKNIKNVINGYQVRMMKPELAALNKQNLAEDIVKTYIKTCDKRFKGYKQITNILVGLFITLPITCHALNWCYPRFMDIFFPRLSRNDKSEAPEEKKKNIGKESK